MDSISERIINARKAKNWTQLDLAKALNVNVKNISRWELGHSKPSIDAAAELANILGVSLDYIGGISDDNKINPLEQLFKNKMNELSAEQVNALKTILKAF